MIGCNVDDFTDLKSSDARVSGRMLPTTGAADIPFSLMILFTCRVALQEPEDVVSFARRLVADGVQPVRSIINRAAARMKV